jgi:hypothetical protein
LRLLKRPCPQAEAPRPPCRASPRPESPRTCARYPARKAAPHSVGGIAQTLKTAAAATQELFHFLLHELAAAAEVFLKGLLAISAPESCTPQLPRPLIQTEARSASRAPASACMHAGPPGEGRGEHGRHGMRAAGPART